ncbi:hypothetical protein K502DRAFT_344353 [Neoconidiobolus thromboides FSU 785]|nr:hypothetical protein K502DRAFT_344353 [Neoconidiobolus thromboides FSU 785]
MLLNYFLILYSLLFIIAETQLETLTNSDWTINLYLTKIKKQYASIKLDKQINQDDNTEKYFTSVQYNEEFNKDSEIDNDTPIEVVAQSTQANYTLGFNVLKCQSPCSFDFVIYLNNEGYPQSFNFDQISSNFVYDQTKNQDLPLSISRSEVKFIPLGPSPILFNDYYDEFLASKKKEEGSSFIMKYWYIIIPAFLIMSAIGGGEESTGEKKD